MQDIESRLKELLALVPDLLDSDKRLKAALRDYFPENRRVQNLLFMAVEAGPVKDARSERYVDRPRMHGYVKCLVGDYGISHAAAGMAIAAWLRVLGIPFDESGFADESGAGQPTERVVVPPQPAPPQKRAPDPAAQLRLKRQQQKQKEQQLLEEVVREYNALLRAEAPDLEGEARAYCYKFLIQRFRMSSAKQFRVEAIQVMPNTDQWWTICWNRTRYWVVSLFTTKYALFPNPRLAHEGRLHNMGPCLDDFFIVMDGEELYPEVNYQPAIIECKDSVWRLASKGIIYIW